MAVTIPLRHELKFIINEKQHILLANALENFLTPDRFGGRTEKDYHIRSLYFDTVFDDALYDKLNGVKDRDKYRIRIYNLRDDDIKQECKTKVGSLISKRSVSIPKLLCEQLIAGDPDGLEQTKSGLLQDMYREMKTRLLRPVVLVDYVREAYISPIETVRVTFDKQLRTGMYSHDLFSPTVPMIPPFDHDEIVLEVKFDHVLPDHLRDVISTYVENAQQVAVSKYTWCRRFEEKEY